MKSLAVNGKFLSASPTGVHRVAAELLCAVDAELSSREARWDLLKPRDATRPLPLRAITQRTVGIATWQPWEQIELPWYARGQHLLSLCNLAPVAHRASIVMMHDAQVFATPQSYSAKFRAWYQLVQPRLGKTALQVLTVSQFSATQLAHYGVADIAKISVVHNGCDHFARVSADTTIVRKLGLEPQAYVVALANTQAHKNVGLLLRAWSDPRLQDIPLVLVGAASAQDFANAGVQAPAGAVFAGSVSDEAFKGLLQSALCLAFPSLTEGFGLPPMEAMSVGCPVVAAPCGALPEVCGGAAVYAGADDPGAWVDAILALDSDRAARDAAVKAGRIRAELFTWERSAQRLLQILDRV